MSDFRFLRTHFFLVHPVCTLILYVDLIRADLEDVW